jgi:hypothetical protein
MRRSPVISAAYADQNEHDHQRLADDDAVSAGRRRRVNGV